MVSSTPLPQWMLQALETTWSPVHILHLPLSVETDTAKGEMKRVVVFQERFLDKGDVETWIWHMGCNS